MKPSSHNELNDSLLNLEKNMKMNPAYKEQLKRKILTASQSPQRKEKHVLAPLLSIILAAFLVVGTGGFVFTQFMGRQIQESVEQVAEGTTKKGSEPQEESRKQLGNDSEDIQKEINKETEKTTDKNREDDIINRPEFNDMTEWVTHQIESLNVDSYEPYADRETYEQHMGAVIRVYAKHYAALESDAEIISQLDKMAEMGDTIAIEQNQEKRTELLEQVEQELHHLLSLVK